MDEPVEVRPLSTLEDARAASALFDQIWDERRVMGAPQLRAMAAHGGQVLGAFAGQEMVGALVGLVGLTEDGRPTLHSHITGVAPDQQHRGVGFLLKAAQRDWCLRRGIDVVTWTMDPLVARNARFNLHKLGAVGDRFHRDYYGPMDDAFNRGDRSDRLEIRWDLRSDRVRGRFGEPVTAGEARNFVSAVVVRDEGGRPVVNRDEGVWDEFVAVAVPSDYHSLRRDDSQLAREWRDTVGAVLDRLFTTGYRATHFDMEVGYLLERR